MIFEALYQTRKITDLKDMLQQSTSLYGNKNAFLVKRNGNNYIGITYNEFKNTVDQLGTAFIDMGLEDCFIAVISENRYEWCTTYLATVNGTGIIVPLDKELPIVEIENLLKRSQASAVVYSGKFDDTFKKLSENLPDVKYFINMDSDQNESDRFLSLKKVIEKGSSLLNEGDLSFIDKKINPDEMRMLIFTSGTTDLAKGVMLSHKNICFNVMATCQSLYIDHNDVYLSILPLHHTYECTAGFLIMIYNGCTIAFCEGLKHITKNMKEIKPTILLLVPLILENLYKKVWDNAKKNKFTLFKLKAALQVSEFLRNILGIDIRRRIFKQIHDNLGGRVRLIIAGAASMPPKVSKGLRKLGFLVCQGYGLTEFSPIVCVNREKNPNDLSIGQPLPGTELIIVNMDANGIGEICVKGDSVMLGYYKNKEATEKVLKDGWLYTGDLGRMDPEGYVYITGRQKNVIVTKNGKNVFPEEVEAYLNKSPFIKESLVTGQDIPDEEETIVVAQILPDIEAFEQKFKSKATPEIIDKVIKQEVKNVNKSMPIYKKIKHYYIRNEEFDKTTTQKIKRYSEKNIRFQ